MIIINKIKDDGLGISSTRMSEIHSLLEGTNEIGSHIGLKNTHQLIQILYGENYGLSLQSKEGNGNTFGSRYLIVLK